MLAIGAGIVELDLAAVRRRLSLPPAVLLGVLLDVAVLAVLATFGRRRQKAARAKAPAGPEQRLGAARARPDRARPALAIMSPQAHPSQAFLDQGLPAHARSARRPPGGPPRRNRARDAANGLGPPGCRRSQRSARSPPGSSITINVDGAIIDAYVVTDQPDEVAAFMAEQGWTAER